MIAGTDTKTITCNLLALTCLEKSACMDNDYSVGKLGQPVLQALQIRDCLRPIS